jgi:hypothetical protein
VAALGVLNDRFQGVTEFYGVEVGLESDRVLIGEKEGPLLPRIRRVAPPEPPEEE